MAFPNMPKPDHGNPWNLTPRQEQVLLVYARNGFYKAVQTSLGLSYGTVESTLHIIRTKMGSPNATVCAVKYSVWRQEQLDGVVELKQRLATALFQLELARKDLDFARHQLHQQLQLQQQLGETA